MDAVEDHLDGHVRPGERDAGHAGVAMGERPHRIEEVGDGSDAAVERRGRLVGARVAMTHRDGHTVGNE